MLPWLRISALMSRDPVSFASSRDKVSSFALVPADPNADAKNASCRMTNIPQLQKAELKLENVGSATSFGPQDI